MDSKALFFYTGPDHGIRPNQGLMPLSVISKFHGDEGPYFRFAYDPSNNKFYVQDDSFRSLLSSGDEKAWDMINHVLAALDKTHGARFVVKAYGDPPDSSAWRKTSDYVDAWRDILEAGGKDDYPVYEYVPTQEQKDDLISLAKPGDVVGGKPVDSLVIKVNRMLHKSSKLPCTSGDVNYDLISLLLKIFYLQNLVPGAENGQSHMFAIRVDDKTRMFNSKDGDDGSPFDHNKIRETLGDYNGPVITFCLDKPGQKIVIKNSMLSPMYDNPVLSSMLEDIKTGASKAFGIPGHQLAMSCDPSMGGGFVSKLSRYEPLWTLASQVPDQIDMEVLEAPLSVRGGAVIVQNAKDEESASPRSAAFRSAGGMGISYPFMLVDGRVGKGKKLRQMLDAYLRFFGTNGEDDNDDFGFSLMIGNKGVRATIKADMEMLTALGHGQADILDFFAPLGDALRRLEYGRVIKEAMESLSGRTVTAAMGKGLNINEWYHGLQENLNWSQHTNDKDKPKHKPFNVKRRNAPPAVRNYEQLLMTKHDNEMNYQKGMEQLLRESQI